MKLMRLRVGRWIAGRCLVEGNAKLNEMDYALLKTGQDASMFLPRLTIWTTRNEVLRGDFSILAGVPGQFDHPKIDEALYEAKRCGRNRVLLRQP